MDKQDIIEAIRSMANENGGKAPGSQRFQVATGLRKSDWYPNLWLRWTDAIREAGCQANSLSSSYESEFLILKYIELIREVGRFPIEGDLIIKHKTDKNFPDRGSFAKLGSKSERAAKILDFCRAHGGYDEIMQFCSEVVASSPSDNSLSKAPTAITGYVYLCKHGSRREYKIGRTNNPVRREGEIRLQLPEKLQPVHSIKTDDPAGIESYWHARFAAKRKEGEWFALTADDVRAFKRWKRIY